MKKMQVVHIATEAAPFSKTGGLADVIGSLPRYLRSDQCAVKVFLPLYRQTRRDKYKLRLLEGRLSVRLGNKKEEFALYASSQGGVDFYFIDNRGYFDRDFLYGTPAGGYPDNHRRFAFFTKAVFESLQEIIFKPDIVHCHEWQTGLAPFFLRHELKNDKFFSSVKSIFTIHNLVYQGLFDRRIMDEIGISGDFFHPGALEFHGNFSFMKSGILYSDAITTVSRTYAQEIVTREFGAGLDGLLLSRAGDLSGILNGVDYADWNPKTDRFIKVNYDQNSLEKKAECKRQLLKKAAMPLESDAPLLGLISRLVSQKGIDIIINSIAAIRDMGARLIVLGLGEPRFSDLLTALSKSYPESLFVKIGFDEALSHQIEAGCDMFLMPSRYEPCGLNQAYSLRYATIPLVRATGGLQDTVIDYCQYPRKGTGFKFQQATAYDFIRALQKAIKVYKDKPAWLKLMARAMQADFPWEKSALEYRKLYCKILSNSQ